MRRAYCTPWKWDRKGSTFVPTINRGGNVVLNSTLHRHISDTYTCRHVHRCQSSTTTTTTTTTSHPPFLRDLFSLEGRCAIVTGGGTGIGLSLAAGLARAGACVMLTARRQKVLEQAKAEIQKQLEYDGLEDVDRRVHVYPSDITDFPQINPLVQEAEYVTGIPPTILVNNAGANLRKPIDEVHSEVFASSQALMITAPFLLTRALAPNFQSQKYGRVVNLASLQSFRAFPDSVSYASVKSGILGLTRALAEAYSAPNGYTNVTVNAVAPGYVRTELTSAVFADEARAQRLAECTISGRNSVPEDLVGATVFLCGPSSSYVTGQTLSVDGGFTALGLR
jgi:NAD(P)-dependent dehydrogenase (short-subunit alcohol dehydrogenase family)